MTLIRSCRTSARSGRAQLVPGGLACAASARRPFVPTPLRLSESLKMASGTFSSRTVTRLAPACS